MRAIEESQKPEGDSWGRLLYDAVQSGRPAQAWRLLEQGAPFDYRGEAGLQALHVACARGDGECAKTLLEHGADPSALANGGASPLALAAKAGASALCLRLLDYGADPNGTDADGVPALHWAARKASQEAVEALLRLGADPNAIAGQTEATALHLVCWEWKFGGASMRLADALLAAGASPLARLSKDSGHGDLTPAELARANGRKDLAEHLEPIERAAREAEEIEGTTRRAGLEGLKESKRPGL